MNSISTLHVFRHPTLGLRCEAQSCVHPPFFRLVITREAVREGPDGAGFVIENPAELDGFVTLLKCGGSLLDHLQQGGRVEHWPEGQFRFRGVEPVGPTEVTPPRAIERR